MTLLKADGLTDVLTHDDFVKFVVTEITALEAQGVMLPTGWRFLAKNLNQLNFLLTISIAQLESLVQNERNLVQSLAVARAYDDVPMVPLSMPGPQ